MPMLEDGNSKQEFQVSQSVQNVKDILAEVHRMDSQQMSQADYLASGAQSSVQMVP